MSVGPLPCLHSKYVQTCESIHPNGPLFWAHAVEGYTADSMNMLSAGPIFFHLKKVKIFKSQDLPKNTVFESFQLNLPKATVSDPVTFILVFFSHFFQKMRQSLWALHFVFFMKFYVARTFLVELHLGVVLEVHLGVGSKLIYRSCR